MQKYGEYARSYNMQKLQNPYESLAVVFCAVLIRTRYLWNSNLFGVCFPICSLNGLWGNVQLGFGPS
jgi:hypothetical protein